MLNFKNSSKKECIFNLKLIQKPQKCKKRRTKNRGVGSYFMIILGLFCVNKFCRKQFLIKNEKAKYHVYVAWLRCCSKKNATYLLELQKSKIDKLVEKWETQWEITEKEIRTISRSYQYALQRFVLHFFGSL